MSCACSYNCRDCDELHPRIFMVHDRVWCGEANLPRFGALLCIPCFEKVLGRKLVPEDFTAAPTNWWPRWGPPLRPEPTEDEIRFLFRRAANADACIKKVTSLLHGGSL